MLYLQSLIEKAIDAWLSLVERCVRDAEVAGSNPVAPTIQGFRYMGERILGRGNRRGF